MVKRVLPFFVTILITGTAIGAYLRLFSSGVLFQMPLTILLTYYVLAALIIWFVYHRWHGKPDASNPRRYRIIFALGLAIIFTPSVISDFFLFMIPGPAIVELVLLLPGAVVHPWPSLYVITIVCLAPLLAGFGIFYLVIWLCDRRRFFVSQTI